MKDMKYDEIFMMLAVVVTMALLIINGLYLSPINSPWWVTVAYVLLFGVILFAVNLNLKRRGKQTLLDIAASPPFEVKRFGQSEVGRWVHFLFWWVLVFFVGKNKK